jgi:hypothetical protein
MPAAVLALAAAVCVGAVRAVGMGDVAADEAAALAANVLGGLPGGIASVRDGEVVATPHNGGDSYGGEGMTFEPLFGNARSTVIVLHGLSAWVSLVVPIVPVAQSVGLTRTRFILPQATVAYVNYRQREEPVRCFCIGSLVIVVREILVPDRWALFSLYFAD